MKEINRDCPYNDCFGCIHCISEWSEYYQTYIITGCALTIYEKEEEEEEEPDETLIDPEAETILYVTTFDDETAIEYECLKNRSIIELLEEYPETEIEKK